MMNDAEKLGKRGEYENGGSIEELIENNNEALKFKTVI